MPFAPCPDVASTTPAVPPRRPGPFDDATWPSKLTARVVTPGESPRIHGYDVEEDLARHYGPSATTLLALVGELPSDERARAFDVATSFLSPAPVNEGPAHATVIVRICNVSTSAIVATAALALGEQARVLIEEHAGWLRCLDTGSAASPGEWVARDASDRRSVERLRAALDGTGVSVPMVNLDIGRTPALLAVLHFAGLRSADRMVAAIVMARLPVAVAEGLATPTHTYKDYAVELPPIRYSEVSE